MGPQEKNDINERTDTQNIHKLKKIEKRKSQQGSKKNNKRATTNILEKKQYNKFEKNTHENRKKRRN